MVGEIGRRALVLALATISSAWAGNPFACEGDTKTRVTDIYPTAHVLPANLLRFYVYFSQPMGREQPPAAIALYDADGAHVPDVFLPTRYALWSADARRLTLIVDPGRVKTGLRANTALGRALRPGKTYTLRIDAAARDDRGCELARAVRKTFRVVAADTTVPAPAKWRIEAPVAGTREPLSVTLGESLDHTSLAFGVRVLDQGSTIVRGAIEVDDDERTWRFRPASPWLSAPYQLVVDGDIEDLAGNRPAASFDRPVDGDATTATLVRRFSPAQPSP